MKVLITGGTGFLGGALAKSLLADGHQVWALSRNPDKAHVPAGVQIIAWDGRTTTGWGNLVNEMDGIVNLAGKSLSTWPWTKAIKQEFWDSRIQAGLAVVEAISKATRRPRVLVQASGINHYGLAGPTADESTPAADDFPGAPHRGLGGCHPTRRSDGCAACYHPYRGRARTRRGFTAADVPASKSVCGRAAGKRQTGHALDPRGG